MEALQKKLESEEKPTFKPSSRLTSLKNTEKQLAKLKKYVINPFVLIMYIHLIQSNQSSFIYSFVFILGISLFVIVNSLFKNIIN